MWIKFISGIIVGIACMVLLQQCTQPQQNQATGKSKVTWFSLPSDDMDRAAQFYERVFGWKIESLTKEADDDFSFQVMVNTEGDANYVPGERGVINGCLVKRKIGLATPAVLVEVENLEQAIESVIKAGGEVVTERITMNSLGGDFVLIKDTEGNYVEIFQNHPVW